MYCDKKNVFLLAICLLLSLYCFADNETTIIRRFALIIGVNDGGLERAYLRYATADAQAFSQVLLEMGGLKTEDQILLLNPNLNEVLSGLNKLYSLVEDSGFVSGRKELLIYYSGHSDENGLLIGNECLLYKELRDAINEIPADVRIAIIDSCSSGVFIRTKGGKKQPAFLIDSSTTMKGYAFLTSSSANEAAQESERIKASFFTYYFISGLRGAADMTHDGMITLNEAYHYAFTETLAQTERTQYGPQHPSYDIQLSGSGDLVLTDIRETSASVILSQELRGRFYIRNQDGNLVVEVNKIHDNSVEIGLEPGNYTILVDNQGNLLQGKFFLFIGNRKYLQAKDFGPVDEEATHALGKKGEEDSGATDSSREPFSLTFIPNFPEAGQSLKTHIVSINLTIATIGAVDACSISAIGSHVQENVIGCQASGIYNSVGQDVTGAQMAGIFNMTHGNNHAFQAAGIFNYASGEFTGVQTSGIFNYNVLDLWGVQIGGIINICEQDVWGTQVSGVANYAQDVHGTQIAGILNMATDVSGCQIGLFNWGDHVEGVQIGLINFSNDLDGFAIGLFNYEREGIRNFEFWVSQDRFAHLGFKFGTKYCYTIISGGRCIDIDEEKWIVGLGWGLHIPISDFFFDVDAMCSSVIPDKIYENVPFHETLLPSLRIKLGLQAFRAFSFFVGVDTQFYIPIFYDDGAYKERFAFDISFKDDETIYIVPSLFAGIQIF